MALMQTKISLPHFLKLAYSGNKLVVHTHRNNEIIFALLLRLLGGKFKLIFTRHSESKPSDFTLWLMKKADHVISLSSSMAKNLPLQSTVIRHGVNTEILNIMEKIKYSRHPSGKTDHRYWPHSSCQRSAYSNEGIG